MKRKKKKKFCRATGCIFCIILPVEQQIKFVLPNFKTAAIGQSRGEIYLEPSQPSIAKMVNGF